MLGTDAAAIARLRASLAAADYDSTGFKRALGQGFYSGLKTAMRKNLIERTAPEKND